MSTPTPLNPKASEEALFQAAGPLDEPARKLFLDWACAGEPELRQRLEDRLFDDDVSTVIRPQHLPEEDLFQAAILLPAAARASFLAVACKADASLRQRLEALLAAHVQPETLLEPQANRRDGSDEFPSSAQGVAEVGPQDQETSRRTIKLDLPDAPDEAVGQTLGRYKLLEKVGEGGCGAVYVAEQTQPVRRRVALKVIKLGMDTKAVVARFEAERQALAIMDHPNIAKVLDAGTTETGRPYFIMELVRGIRITDYCDQNNLSTRDRLDLFLKVCQAIQHAHQKGIIHRDIKPSNILVTLHDGQPVPKVIDFGIAKATEGRLTEATVYTQLHQFIGTPAYMSPEQAEMSGLDIDTRSDIYSLGVLLYELLTGRTPFDANELMSQGIDAMRKIIREQEPVRPSTRFATLKGEELTTTARRRSAEAPKLIHLLRGDLDWIVMKALEKDRTRRYETATGLAADIRRHLNNEPVVARPPSQMYRVRKFVRRNKLACAAAMGVGTVLVLGTAVSTWQAIRATKAERVQGRLHDEAEKARAAEAKERSVAEQRLYDLLLSGARTRRQEHHVGYRDEAFKILRQAAALDVPQKNLAALRSEAVACLGDIGGPTPITFTNFPAGTDIKQTQIDPAGRAAAFLLFDGTILLRQLPSGEEIERLNANGQQRIWEFCFGPSGDQIISRHHIKKPTWAETRAEARLRYWNRGPDGHWREARSVALPGTCQLTASAKGVFAAVIDPDVKQFKLVDVNTMDEILRTALPDEDIVKVTLSPDHGFLAVASQADPKSFPTVAAVIDIWSLKTSQHVKRVEPGFEGIMSMSFSPDGRYFAVLSINGSAIYSTATFERVSALPESFDNWNLNVSFASHSALIALPLDHRRVRLFDVSIQKDVAVLDEPEAANEAIFARDDRFLLCSGKRVARLYDLSRAAERLNLFVESGPWRTAFSPDGTQIAFLGKEGSATVHDTISGRTIWMASALGEPSESRDYSTAVAFSPEGLLAVSSPSTERVWIWDESSRRRLIALGTNEPPVNRMLQFTGDGRHLVALASSESTARFQIHVWRVERRGSEQPDDGVVATLVKRLDGELCRYVALAPDNRRFAYGSIVGGREMVSIAELDGQAPPRQLETTLQDSRFSHQGYTFTPDSRQLLVVDRDRNIVTADVATGATISPALATIDPARPGLEPTLSISLSPDGSRLAVTSTSERGVDLWDWKERRLLYSLPEEDGQVWGGRVWGSTWSPDSQRLAVARDQNDVTIWNLTEVERALTRLGLDPHPTPERVSRMDSSIAEKQ